MVKIGLKTGHFAPIYTRPDSSSQSLEKKNHNIFPMHDVDRHS